MPDATTMPTYQQVIHKLKSIAADRSEWAGLPMLVDGYHLRLEPRFPYQFNVCTTADVNESQQDKEVLNVWWSDKLMAHVYVVAHRDKSRSFVDYYRGGMKATKLIDDLICSSAWLFEAELKAMTKLATMIPNHLFNAYVMTGSFLESSKRSRITYVFRRLRPTLAMSGSDGTMRALCALCLHPIGYYSGTHVGVMVPTDDVIAHLTYMRGDEHSFWKQAEQHPTNHPGAGL